MSELRQYCESNIIGLLRSRGRRPPMLRRVRCLINPHRAELVIEFQFEDAADYSLRIDCDVFRLHIEPRQTDQLCDELRSLYFGLAEDHILQHDTDRARDFLRRRALEGADPGELYELRRRIEQAVRHQQDHHRSEPPIYTSAVAAPPPRRTYSFPAGPLVDELSELTPAAQAVANQHLQRMMAAFERDTVRVMWVDPGGAEDWTTFYGGQAFFGADVGDAKANRKGLKLLREWLTPEQREQYKKNKWFEVVGSDTGKRYRIRHGRQMNIDELGVEGSVVCGWCFLPEGQLVAGDVMLAQKIALETFELEALKKANRFEGGITGAVINGNTYPGGITWVDRVPEPMPSVRFSTQEDAQRAWHRFDSISLRPGAVNVVVADPTS